MLMDAIGTEQMQVLPFTGKRGTFDAPDCGRRQTCPEGINESLP
jgi:hypothetical protein